MKRQLAADVVRLLETTLDTFEKVEIVWHLHVASAPLDVAELATRIEMGQPLLMIALEELVGSHLVERHDERTVTLGARARRPDVEALVRIHSSDRYAVIPAFMSIAIDRIRTMAARTFADAFVLRRKKRDPND